MPHFVRIELAYPKGWWRSTDHAQLVDPQKYASSLLARPGAGKGTVIGVRITDHDSDEVWTAGQSPDVDQPLVIEAKTPEPEPESAWSDAWDDLLGGDPDEEPPAAPASWEDVL